MNPNLLTLDEMRRRLRWCFERGQPTAYAMAQVVDIPQDRLKLYAAGEMTPRGTNRLVISDFFRKIDTGFYTLVEVRAGSLQVQRADQPRPPLHGCVTLSHRGAKLRFKTLPELMGYEQWPQQNPDDGRPT